MPTEHSDAEYDPAVLGRLRHEVHPRILTILTTAEPRFTRYRERFEASFSAIDAGDLQLVAHPFRDSYHTVWFQLHEELIRLTGRNRAEEAAWANPSS